MIAVSDDRKVERSGIDAQPIQSDHEAIRSLLERLEGMIDKLVAHDTAAKFAMPELLGEFREVLLLHFDREEQSGVLEHAALEEPRFADRIEDLILEHTDLRRAVDQICEGPAGDCWGDFEARFVSFRSALAEHERAENEVLMAVYVEDLGGHH
jgi:uncharacterized protein (UPF0335 family)